MAVFACQVLNEVLVPGFDRDNFLNYAISQEERLCGFALCILRSGENCTSGISKCKERKTTIRSWRDSSPRPSGAELRSSRPLASSRRGLKISRSSRDCRSTGKACSTRSTCRCGFGPKTEEVSYEDRPCLWGPTQASFYFCHLSMKGGAKVEICRGLATMTYLTGSLSLGQAANFHRAANCYIILICQNCQKSRP